MSEGTQDGMALAIKRFTRSSSFRTEVTLWRWRGRAGAATAAELGEVVPPRLIEREKKDGWVVLSF